MKHKMQMKRAIIAVIAVFFIISDNITGATFSLENLMVEYSDTPIGIDVKLPRFSWQMKAPVNARGYEQIAYQLVVKDNNGVVVWDPGRVKGNASVGIVYAGKPLAATTKYNWTVIVWDQNNESSSASSWFETGLMNSGITAWEGAKWIGGEDNDLVLYADYFPLFRVSYSLAIAEGSTRAAFILAANDPRLMDKNKNIFQLENAANQSFFKIELDIAGIAETEQGRAKLNVYRVGYAPDDKSDKPFKTFLVKLELVNATNKNQPHKIDIRGEYGELYIEVDGNSSFVEPVNTAAEQPNALSPGFRGRDRGVSVNLNPMGRGHDYLPFGMLCNIGFAMEGEQKATFSDLEILNYMRPHNKLFSEDLDVLPYRGLFREFSDDVASGLKVMEGKYVLDGGTNGIFIVADPSRNGMPMLRSVFTANDKGIKYARLYVTARGIYEMYLNGKRVGNDYYNPGLTQYNKTHLYQTYDVTTMLKAGQNAIGAMLGEGWWSGMLSFGTNWNYFGDRQSLLAKLVITYDDGSKDVVVTNDRDWKFFNKGPIVYSSLDMGEVYDASREAFVKGWSLAAFDDSDWKQAVEVIINGTANTGSSTDFRGVITDFNYDNLSIIGQIGKSAGVYKILTSQSVKEVRKGVFVYNMGQNMVGVPNIAIANGKGGHKITIRVSEMLYPDLPESGKNTGMLMTENYRAALCQDIYIMKEGQQVFQPRFTSRGYQYLEITGLDEPLPLEAVKGIAISSVTELTAEYQTSNEKVNKLWSNLVWSNIDNFLSIPTDCPQRNERMGWSGDISVFSRTATYVSNADQFLRRHLMAMRDVQLSSGKFTDIAPVGGGFGGVLWGSAGITVPWEVYQQYNDLELLREHYPAMKAYIQYIQTTLSPETGLSSDGQLGDWLGPQNNQLGTAYLVTAYHIYDLWIISQVASLLGESGDAAKFGKLYIERKAFFNKQFINEEHKTMGIIGGGIGFSQPAVTPELKLADTQTSYAVGLALGAFNEENIPYMAKNLKETVERLNLDDQGVSRPKYSLMTGFIGTAWISKALSDYGYEEQAYRLLQNNHYPSWLYPVDQGATTIWERLNGYTLENGFGGNNGMNSFNHYSFGAVGQWLIAYSLGIQRNEPGFKKFILQPQPDPTGQMTWAKGYYDSMYGKINSEWKMEGGILSYQATVPANTTATLYLPAASLKGVKEGGKPVEKSVGVKFIKFENGKAVYELVSGSYAFEVKVD